jgi:hypothetical protein
MAGTSPAMTKQEKSAFLSHFMVFLAGSSLTGRRRGAIECGIPYSK